MPTRIATHTYHTLDYYYGLLTALITFAKRRLTHADIAGALNEQGILSPTGKQFSRGIVSNMLRQLRMHEEYRPLVYQAMLELYFDDRLAKTDCLALLNYRPGKL